MNTVAEELIRSIEKYIQESSKVNYRFSLEEQIRIQREIQILNNQIDMLVEYEAKRKEK